MTVSFAVGSFQKSGSQVYPVSQSVTVGFQPKAMMFFGIASGTTGATAFTDIERPGFGWTTGSSSNYALSWGYDDATTAGTLSNTFRRARNDYCLTYGSASSTAYPQIRLVQFTGTGADLEYDLNDTNQHKLFWVAVGGSDIIGAKAGEFTPITSPTTQSVINVGFQPDIVFFMTANSPNLTHPASGSSSTSNLLYTFGVAKSSTARACLCSSSIDAINPTDSARRQRTDRCIMFFTEASTTIAAEADLVSMDPDGFTINWATATSDPQPIYYLAIKGGSWNVGTTLSRTSADGTGTRAITGLGHTPKGLMLFGFQGPDHGNVTTNAEFSFGAASGTTSSVHFNGGNMDNSTVPSSYRSYNLGSSSTNVYVYKNHNVGTQNQDNVHAGAESTYITSRALLQSFDSNTGFTLNWELVPTNAEQLIYVTVGDNLGSALVKFVNESMIVAEGTPLPKGFGRQREINESITITEAPPVIKKAAALVKFVNESTTLTEGSPLIKVLKKLKLVNETVTLDEDLLTALKILRRINESVGLTEELVKNRISPTDTLQPSAIQLRYSGGTTINAGTNASSRGGTMSNNSVTDNTINNAWDDVLSSESSAGRTEYRCYYLYNTDTTLTAYNCEMWVDTETPAGDSVQIGVGAAAPGGTEQGPTASETTAPNSPSITFVTAPDPDSAINLGNIAPLTSRSFWIKRNVPAGTLSWADNMYRLRLSFYSEFAGTTPPPPPIPPSGGFLTQGFLTQGFITT